MSDSTPDHDLRPRSDDDLVDVLAYARVLWTRRVPLIAWSFAVAVAVVAISWSLGVSYRADATLGVGGAGLDQDAISRHVVSIATLAESQTVVAAVLDALQLQDEPYGFTVGGFRRNALDVEPVEGADFVRVSVTLDDPALAAAAANRVADEVLKMARAVNVSGVVRVRDDLKRSLDEAAARLGEAETAAETYRRTAQIELVRKDVDMRLNQRGSLQSLLVDIETERARIAQIQSEMAGRVRIGTLTQSIGGSAAMMELARQTGTTGSDLLSLQLQSEYVDVVYQGLDAELTGRQATLAGLEQTKTELVDGLKLDGPELAALNRLYEREATLERLTLERTLAERAYTEAAVEYQGAELREASRLPILQIIDPAVTPDESLGRGLLMRAVLGSLTGFLIGAVFVLSRHGAGSQ